MKIKNAFTMAEILLSLTIIGVVAAITLPSLTGNINERTWNTKRKALYARMTQAISLMPALNGYGIVTEATSSSSAVDTATETFLTEGLAKVLKINNICDNTHLEDCGISTSIITMSGSKITMPTTLHTLNSRFNIDDISNTNAAAFETVNGESIVAYYNNTCQSQHPREYYPTFDMCVNFIYDLNGNKGPNTVGKDIGIISVFNATDSIVVAPVLYSTTSLGETTTANASKTCTQRDAEIRLPNITELSSMYINGNITGVEMGGLYWSSTYTKNGLRYTMANGYGGFQMIDDNYNITANVFCIKR